MKTCPRCAGNGYHIHDSCDHRGEHVQLETTCGLCQGKGEVKNDVEDEDDLPNAKPIVLGFLIVIGFAIFGIVTLFHTMTRCAQFYF